MCDVFEDNETIANELQKLWPLIRATPNLTWQLLTKRADRIAECLPDDWGEGYPNVWLGVSVENTDYVWRTEQLRNVPARVRFVSYEPALGPIHDAIDLREIHWLIYGGESGPGRRSDDDAWSTGIAELCHANDTAFFFKQRSAGLPGCGTMPDGSVPREFPSAY